MIGFATFALGLAAGWVARGTTESSRAAVLNIAAAVMSAFDRVKRVAAIEKDHLEDLVAEARARAETLRQERTDRKSTPSPCEPLDEAAA